ncbi:MAG: hypothetical protein JJU00_04515 [Opitutales bacterium]|nr:hypothetical protein [Opitutales bacterium]
MAEIPEEGDWLHWQSTHANWPHPVEHRLGIEALAIDQNQVLRVRLPEDRTDLDDRWGFVIWEDRHALSQGLVQAITADAGHLSPNRPKEDRNRLWVDRFGQRVDSDWWTNDPQILAAIWRYIAPHKLDPDKEEAELVAPGPREVIPWEEAREITRRTLADYPWAY